jgi:hypothetical protein
MQAVLNWSQFCAGSGEAPTAVAAAGQAAAHDGLPAAAHCAVWDGAAAHGFLCVLHVAPSHRLHLPACCCQHGSLPVRQPPLALPPPLTFL